jgi:hypothetical protein
VEQEFNFMRSRKIHINEAVLDENGAIDQYKIDLVSLGAIGIQVESRVV